MTDESKQAGTSHLTDDQFVERFENCTLPAAWFHHRDHIRLAWLNVRRYGLPEALAKVSEGIKRFAAAQGKAERYHETITWAYVFLVNQRLAQSKKDQDWAAFADANPDLLDWENGILGNYYHRETLASELARRTFVFPDKLDPQL